MLIIYPGQCILQTINLTIPKVHVILYTSNEREVPHYESYLSQDHQRHCLL